MYYIGTFAFAQSILELKLEPRLGLGRIGREAVSLHLSSLATDLEE